MLKVLKIQWEGSTREIRVIRQRRWPQDLQDDVKLIGQVVYHIVSANDFRPAYPIPTTGSGKQCSSFGTFKIGDVLGIQLLAAGTNTPMASAFDACSSEFACVQEFGRSMDR